MYCKRERPRHERERSGVRCGGRELVVCFIHSVPGLHFHMTPQVLYRHKKCFMGTVTELPEWGEQPRISLSAVCLLRLPRATRVQDIFVLWIRLLLRAQWALLNRQHSNDPILTICPWQSSSVCERKAALPAVLRAGRWGQWWSRCAQHFFWFSQNVEIHIFNWAVHHSVWIGKLRSCIKKIYEHINIERFSPWATFYVN